MHNEEQLRSESVGGDLTTWLDQISQKLHTTAWTPILNYKGVDVLLVLRNDLYISFSWLWGYWA